MARQQVVSYTVTCDVCGEEISESDIQGASQKISWEGRDYVVDMCARDQAALGAVLVQLKVFVDAGSERVTNAGRRTAAGAAVSRAKARGAGTRRAGAPVSSGPRSNMPAIRAWAVDNGHQVGHRGRIPAGVLAAYDEAHSSGVAAAPPGPKKRQSRNAVAATTA